MKKTTATIVALLMAFVMAMPVTAMAATNNDSQAVEDAQLVIEERVINGAIYLPLRQVINAYGFPIEWDAGRQAAVVQITAGEYITILINDLGGFIENGVTWMPIEVIEMLLVFAFDLLNVEAGPVERIDLTLWEPENFENVREPMFSLDLPHGAISLGYIEHMSDNLGARSAFTYRELEAAVWIVEELLAMGHDWDNISVQEFTYWDALEMDLGLFGALDWNLVTSPMILGLGRDYQIRQDRVSQNVVLTLPGQSERMIIVGAHYDSPPYASASDNASGTALLLESAKRMMELEHYYTIVYVFFGSEEVGLIGAYYYYESLTARERDNIVMMVNADVLIEGPYIIYGAGVMPTLTSASRAELRENLLYEMMDLIEMQYNFILANVENILASDPDAEVTFPFASLEEFVALVAEDIALLDDDTLLLNAALQGIIVPDVNAVAQMVTDIAAELSATHDFELLSFPEAIAFPTDSLVFLFEGITVVNLLGMERAENVSDELAAQLTRFGEGFHDFSVTILHTPLDEFHFIERSWPGMMEANMEAFMLLLEAILTGSFS